MGELQTLIENYREQYSTQEGWIHKVAEANYVRKFYVL